VPLYGTAYRAVVVPSSAPDNRRQLRLARDRQASTLHSAARTAAQQADFCRAEAAAAAAHLRAVHAACPRVDVTVAERPVYGRGRPRPQKPRPLKAIRYRLQTPLSAQAAPRARLEEEAGCCGLRTHVPTAGDLAPSAQARLPVSKDQQGTEPNYGLLKAPVLVHRLFLKQPERLAA
jgi:hypothetical protein